MKLKRKTEQEMEPQISQILREGTTLQHLNLFLFWMNFASGERLPLSPNL